MAVFTEMEVDKRAGNNSFWAHFEAGAIRLSLCTKGRSFCSYHFVYVTYVVDMIRAEASASVIFPELEVPDRPRLEPASSSAQ